MRTILTIAGLTIAVGVLAASAGAAQAEGTKPVSITLTCGDLMNLIKEKETQTTGIAILWLDGVYSAKAGKTTIPEGWATTLGQGVGGNCAISANAGRTVLDIVGEVHEKYAK